MNEKIMKNKRGLSEIIAYVLLIMIAISLSLLVYAWLKGYIIKPAKECPDGVSLIIEDYYCNPINKTLQITFLNKGLFNINGFIIKASNKTGKLPIYPLKGEGNSNFNYFPGDNGNGLEPNNKLTYSFNYSLYSQVVEVEIIPLKEEDLLCNKATIRQEIEGCIDV